VDTPLSKTIQTYILFVQKLLGIFEDITTRLPDGLFSNPKSQFGKILEGLAMENLGIFYDHLVYLTAIWYILWSFGIFCGHLVHFSPFWYFVPRKIWQPTITILAI
jgi:hypothetical protein